MKATIIIIVVATLAEIFSTDLEEVVYTPNYASKSFVAKQFAQKNKMDSTVCFLIDMKAHSGKKRFAIWDLNGDSTIREMIVCHGSAGAKGLPISSADSPVFSNIPSSYASSLGKYRVGKRSYSNWGINIHYKLHGLESTNSNAFRRIIVLHSFIGVGSSEVYPEGAPSSLGCPMVSNQDMTYLDNLLKKKKNILLWIYF
jgi:hypothetical protein